MTHLFVNAAAASAGGGLTYIRNVLPRLAARDDIRVTVLLGKTLRGEIGESARVTLLCPKLPTGSARRIWYEQCNLPGFVRRSGADVLLSTGNFALYRSPVPQILLSRNALYLSADFQRDLRERGDYRLWLDADFKSLLALWSVRTADCTVAPSAAFAHDLSLRTGRGVLCIHHGFDRATFFGDPSPLPEYVQSQLAATEGSLRLLFVSHYNYYRNFETLIRAVALVKKIIYPKTVRLMLTCKLNPDHSSGDYRAASAAVLVQQLGLADEVVELGAVSYSQLHRLYRACHLYVSPAYAETFAHPLVEAMASGLPVLASDLPVHREICRDAALYFPRFSSDALAALIVSTAQSEHQFAALRQAGLSRSQDFSWDKHVDELLDLAHRLERKS
jgi:glycosyltransferase involved in cell wall biosynthesis